MKLTVSPKVDDRGLRMRTSPGFNGQIVTILQSGELLESLDAFELVQVRLGVKDQWLHVRDMDGRSGYCAAWLLLGSDGELPSARSLSHPQFTHANPDFSSEISPLPTVQPRSEPQQVYASSELTPLPAWQPLPDSPQIIPPPRKLPEQTQPIPSELYYDVPVFSQDDLYGNAACSPVSACMLLEYYHRLDPHNRTVSPQQLIAMLDPGDGTPGKGMSLSNLTDELLSLGYQQISEKIHATLDDLKTELLKGPVIVTVGVTLVGQPRRLIQGPGKTIHAMVVKGILPGGVIVNDPWSGRELRIPEKPFEGMWRNGLNGMYRIRP